MSLLCLPRTGVAVLLAGVALGGCQSLQSSDNFLGVLTPYRVEVVQGNVITSEQVALARPGMTRAQVRDVMGSPLLADPFHADRWDYVFTIRRQGAEPQLRRIIVLFKSDVLASIEGGADLPSEREFVASIDPDKAPRNPPDAGADRGADQGAAGADAPACARAGSAGAGTQLSAARAAALMRLPR